MANTSEDRRRLGRRPHLQRATAGLHMGRLVHGVLGEAAGYRRACGAPPAYALEGTDLAGGGVPAAVLRDGAGDRAGAAGDAAGREDDPRMDHRRPRRDPVRLALRGAVPAPVSYT